MKTNQGNSQRGAFLILVAFLLPLIMAMLGFVIDFGNVYWHKSVLQNCADASALGGAKVGAGKQFNHKAADEKVAELHDKNKRYASEIKKYQKHNGRYCDSKSNSKVHYYVVTMTEKVPMYFLRYFGFKEMEIEASCIVRIPGCGGSFPLFDNLITYSKKLYITPSYTNDAKKTFKGNIYKTKSDAEGTVLNYIVNGTDLHLIKNNGEAVDINDSKNYHDEFAVELDDPKNKDLQAYIEELRKNTKKTSTTTQKITEDDLKEPVTYIYDDDSNKRLVSQIDINNDFDTNPNNTHILIVTDGAVNLNFNSNVTCKLIIINLSSQNFAINSKGKIHATIYAPNVSQIVWNPSNSDFYGSIVAPQVELQGGSGNFIHESPDLSGDSNGTSNGITLANGDDVAW